MNSLSIFLVLTVASFAACSFPGKTDLVTNLPGVKFPFKYRHFSGYLEAGNKTFLHYWLFESQTGHSEKDPVVLWLNGGPGYVYLLKAMSELSTLKWLLIAVVPPWLVHWLNWDLFVWIKMIPLAQTRSLGTRAQTFFSLNLQAVLVLVLALIVTTTTPTAQWPSWTLKRCVPFTKSFPTLQRMTFT